MTISVRRAETSDVGEVARLAGQLGYPDFHQGNFIGLIGSDRDDETLLVATNATTTQAPLLGWIHLRHWRTILVGDLTDIGGLVVDENQHGGGVGRKLITAAAEWSRARGVYLVQARSGSQRRAAHEFYLHLGFTLLKQQLIFHLDVHNPS